MKKDDNNIDKLFDKEFDEFMQGEIKGSYSPDEEIKKRIKSRVMKSIENNEEERKENITSLSDVRDKNMKSKTGKKKIGKIATIVASLVIVVGIGTGITIGKDFMTTTKVVKAGRITIDEEQLDVDPSEIVVRLPEELKGKVFDKNGKALDYLNGSMKDIYDENGKRIEKLPIDEHGNYKAENIEETIEFKNFKDINEAAKYANFKLRILPGMNIDKVEFLKTEDGKVDGDYVSIYQSRDGQQIVLAERKGTDELSYETGGSKVDKVRVLGKDAILYNEHNIELDNGDSYIGIYAKLSDYRNDNLVKLANTLVEVK